MGIEKKTIQLTLSYQGATYRVQTYPNQYYSLMTLIADTLAIPGLGLCCGMGSCGTCIIQISHHHSSVKKNILSCATLINDDLANTRIFIPDKVY